MPVNICNQFSYLWIALIKFLKTAHWLLAASVGCGDGGLCNYHLYLEFLIFGLLKHAQGSLVGGLKLGFHGLVLLDGLLQLMLQLLPLVVGELPEHLQVLPVAAGALLQSLLHLGDLPARAPCPQARSPPLPLPGIVKKKNKCSEHLNPAEPPLPVGTPRRVPVTLKNLGMASLPGASQLQPQMPGDR